MADANAAHRYERLPSGTQFSALSFISSIYKLISLSFVSPLLKKGAENDLDEFSAFSANPLKQTVCELTDEFNSVYSRLKDLYDSEKSTVTDAVLCALLRQHAFALCMHLLLTALWSGSRLLGSFSIRWFLMWLSNYKAGDAKVLEGWFWGLLLVVSPMIMTLFDTHVFWIGSATGWKMKMSMTAAIHAKLVTLNSSSVSKITTGNVVNLASNDVQRFFDASVFWPYLIIAPIETILVLIMLSFVLGFLPAISGLSCVLLLVPLQTLLSKQIGNFRRKASGVTDKRINFMSELISGNLAVKMLGWEDPLVEKVNGIRNEEHKLLKKMSYIKASTMATAGLILTVMACVTFVVYRFTGDEFKVPDVLFAMSLFSLPQLFMAGFFVLAMQFSRELAVSTKRIDDFFRLPEVDNHILMKEETVQNGEIIVQNGDYGWFSTKSEDNRIGLKRESKQEFESPSYIQTLASIDFRVRPGDLVGITGRVGSGKSSLLYALLNDMENLNPDHLVQMKGTISYCAQVPWIMAATVRDNIVFGNEFDEDLYDQVISSCALKVDLEQFPFGDQTEIGERGINLSGGQKARIALARAAYSKADINLLDDPLSAVDPKVGRILFDRCIGGVNALMKNSTRLLVTHQKQFLPLCDHIILMNNGRIECIGTWSELSNHHLLHDKERMNSDHDVCGDHRSSNELEAKRSEDLDSSLESMNHFFNASEALKDGKKCEIDNQNQLVEKEDKMSGKVSLKVYWDYIRHIGIIPFSLTILVMLISRVLCFGTEWWIADWASTDPNDQRNHKWIWVLVALTTGVVVTVYLATFAAYGFLVQGSTSLHRQMTRRVICAPLAFFHRNPTGRILNRFSKDTGIQDNDLPRVATDLLQLTLKVIGAMVIASIALPYLVPVIFVIFIGLRYLRDYYVVSSREIRRYDAITRSPVYAMLSSNIKALPTIHAFQKEENFHSVFMKALDLNGSWALAYSSTSLWVALRMDMFLIVICAVFVILSVSLADKTSEKIIGLALVYIVALSGDFQWWMRQTAELENIMTAVERNLEYTTLDQEPPRASEGGGDAPENWPLKGTIEYSSVTASYRPDLEPVLKQLQFVIPGGTTVGIVGRTGSGKSSLLLSLFRLIDINQGHIYIDGLDTSSIGIDVLRRQLAIIPQDPVLFGGTFRSNLDPWSEFSDAQIWTILTKVHLDETIEALSGIDAPVTECGNNLSVGQRQLLCLARALLMDSKILALDEATANVDRTTDAMIQDALHTLVSGNEKTLLIIAHRIDTVLDCDLLLVLEGGRMVEFGSPVSLLSQSNGVFKKMVDAAREAASTIEETDGQ
eukprot:g7746.t1